MESNDRNQLPNGDAASNRDIDWSRYGLHSAETQRSNELRRNNGQYEELGPEMYQTGANELFAQEYVSNLFSENKALPLPFNMCLLVSEFRSLVEIKLLHFAACIVWNMGRCVYILSY